MGTTSYTVSDGKLMLILMVAEEGGYNVSSPLDPQLITQADTLEEAFENAYDVREALIQARAEKARAFLAAPVFQKVIVQPKQNPAGVEVPPVSDTPEVEPEIDPPSGRRRVGPFRPTRHEPGQA